MESGSQKRISQQRSASSVEQYLEKQDRDKESISGVVTLYE
ncbi:Hypothetical protein EAG7_03951 [Klebsiella aerogenes]|nr:Hypothetical protein EAG7_03951 [Klebsiella aerogenes]CCG32527.1 hypothetical protein [Klebsiella aerogenes EA1509E]